MLFSTSPALRAPTALAMLLAAAISQGFVTIAPGSAPAIRRSPAESTSALRVRPISIVCLEIHADSHQEFEDA